MLQTSDKVAAKLLALIAPEEEWFALVSAESVGQAQKTALVRDLRIEPQVLLEAATEIRANRGAFEQIRGLLFDECPCPPCFFSLSPVIVELLRLYYRLRLPSPGTAA